MFPERLRERNELYPAECIQKSGVNLATVVKTGAPIRNLGTHKLVLDNKSVNYKPGMFRLNPAEFRTFNASCTSDVVTFPPRYTGDSWGTQLSGPIAGLRAIPNDGTGVASVLYPSEMAKVVYNAQAGVTKPRVDVGMMLVESEKTLDMFTKPLKELVKILRNPYKNVPLFLKLAAGYKLTGHRPHDLARLQKLSDDVAHAWLQTRYGILPLVSDINGLRKQYAKGFKLEQDAIHRSSAGSTVSQNREVVETYDLSGQLRGRWKNITTTQIRVSTTVYFRNYWYQSYGADVMDIPSTLWEIVPYSFVVDWAFDVGNWLRNMQPQPGIIGLGMSHGTRSTVNFERYNISLWRDGLPEDNKLSTTSFYSSTMDKHYREIGGIVPPYHPGVDLDCLNLTRKFDSLFLLWQNLPKLR